MDFYDIMQSGNFPKTTIQNMTNLCLILTFIHQTKSLKSKNYFGPSFLISFSQKMFFIEIPSTTFCTYRIDPKERKILMKNVLYDTSGNNSVQRSDLPKHFSPKNIPIEENVHSIIKWQPYFFDSTV